MNTYSREQIRRAILSVVDEGDQVLLAEWNFYDKHSDDFSNAQRLDFADAVQAYLDKEVNEK